MAVNEVVDRLAQVPIFAGCSKKELASIARAVKTTEHPAGAVVAVEGDSGAGLFVIDRGTADVTIGGRRVNRLGEGDFFGEMALLDGGPRTATVTATSDLRTYVLTEWVFRGLLQQHPSIALRTLEAMASRLRNAGKAPAS